MVHCSVLGCRSRSRSERNCDNVTYHKFPTGVGARKIWIAFTGRKNWIPSKNDRMCSKHFESYCFHKTKFEVNLNNYALPTLCNYNIKTSKEENTKAIEAILQLYRNEIQEELKKSNKADVEMDDAITDVTAKNDDMECTSDPTSFPVHTFTVNDELLVPEEQLPHTIEVTVECDVEDSEQNTKDSTKDTIPISKIPKGPSSWGGNRKFRPAFAQLKKLIKPIIEKFVSDEEIDPQEITERNSKVLETEQNGVDNKNQNEIQEEDLEYFQWKPLKGWQGVKRAFLDNGKKPTSVFTSPYSTFRAIWDNSILIYMAIQTNRHGCNQTMTDSIWTETNIDEILVLFAFWIMLGIIKMPTIQSCYAHNVSILRTDVFRRLLSENRYINLTRSFYVLDKSKDPNDPEDFLYHFRTLFDHLNVKFKEYYNLDQNICIDESTNLWKTNNPMGIKIHNLCESKTGYIWSFLVDSNRITSNLPDVVYIMKLLQPLLHLGHTLFTNSWFSSPILARYLKQKHVNFVGSLRNFKDIPRIIKNGELNVGEYVARQCGDLMVLAFNGGKRQYYLSNYHDVCQMNDSESDVPGQKKLQIVYDYEHGLRKNFRNDYCIEPYLEHGTKWQLKLFKILLNMTIHNARVLLEKSTNVKIDSLDFRLSLVQAIIERHHSNVPRIKTINLPAERLTGRHFIRRINIPGEEYGKKINNMCLIRNPCVWCKQNGRDSKTNFECPDCNVALCLDVCFEEFHTISG